MIKSTWKFANDAAAKAAARLPDFLLLAIHLYWGWQFFVTGKGKLMNLEGTTGFFTELGLPFSQVNAIMAGSTECLGGLLLWGGLGSQLIAVPLIFTFGPGRFSTDARLRPASTL